MEPDAPSEGSPPERPPGWLRRNRRLLSVLAVMVALAAVDLSRAPQKQLSARALLSAIDLYQATLSKMMPTMGVQCRFKTTCSHYGEAAIRKHGALKGSLMAGWRILRCGPWTEAGTEDLP